MHVRLFGMARLAERNCIGFRGLAAKAVSPVVVDLDTAWSAALLAMRNAVLVAATAQDSSADLGWEVLSHAAIFHAMNLE